MDGVGDTAKLEEIFLSVKETWEQGWKEYRVKLATQLGERFEVEELRDLCFRLGVKYNDLPAEGNKYKARELVTLCERHNRLDELVRFGKRMMPKVKWSNPPVVMDALWQEVDWQEVAQRYSAYIRRACGTMRIFGQHAPVSLEGIFTDVYMLDQPTAWRRYQIEELQKTYRAGELPEHKAKRKRGIEAVLEHQRLFILGKPGAGKTTFLKYMALQAIAGQLDKVPIFVSLKALADSGKELLDYVVSQFATCQLPDTQSWLAWLLASGRAIVLFDGLDEVNQVDNAQQKIAIGIEQFSRNHYETQILITCRIAATEYTFIDFTYVEMADFTPAQVQTFVGKWFRTEGKKQRAFLAELEKRESEGLRELAKTPLLLALLCLAFHETLTFPRRRVEIYEEAIDALLKKWDSARSIQRDEIYRDLSLGRKRQMFARIAAETFEKGIYFIPQRELERLIVEYLRNIPPGRPAEEIDGEAILKAIEARHGILIERARGIYSFIHLTFQEYFVARHFVENAAQGAIERLISEHLTSPHWREVFLLTASLLDNADSFFEHWLEALARTAAKSRMATLLRWSGAESQVRLSSESNLVSRRAGNLFFALVLDLDRDLDVALALARALAFASDLDLDQVLVHARALDRSLTRSLGLTHTLARALTRDSGYLSIIQTIQEIIEMARLLGLVEVQINLENLVLPSDRSKIVEWVAFADELEQVIRKYTPWQDQPPSSSQIEEITHYLNANLLLLDCLQLAYVSDREGIKNRMLLLPE